MTEDRVKVLHKSTALSDELLTEIGRITVLFAILEHDLRELVHWLLGLPENVARAITSELSFRGLYQLAASLVKERAPDMSSCFRDVLKRVSKAEDNRNRISHSLWGAFSATHAVRTKYSAKASRGLYLSREVLSADDLHEISTIVSIAAFDVEAFLTKLRDMRANNSFKPDPLRESPQFRR